VGDRAALTGIVFVLRSGIPWKMLPREMGCGSGVTCWRRLKAWQRTGAWKRLHQVLLSKLRQAERVDFSRAVADSSSIRALGAGKKLDRTQPIAVVPARSITSLPTRKAFRSRSF
jgi:transposase